jgi:hypothetical protein
LSYIENDIVAAALPWFTNSLSYYFSLAVTSSLCGVTICRRQQRDSSFIKCDTGIILFENVTGIDRTCSSLRGICTDKTSCDIYRICQDPRNQNIRVSYTCNIRKHKGRIKCLIDWYAIFNAIEINKKMYKSILHMQHI